MRERPRPRSAARAATVPGQAHVDDDAKGHIKQFSALKPAEVNETCLTCHNRGSHAGWEGSTHEARNLSCTTCHSVHKPQSFEHQLVKATETQLCATCHRQQVVKTERAVAHMPVREGKMSCSSCHNPHGSISNVKNLKVGSSVNELCTSCHAEMRGPMLWEHAPVRENCTTCHDPHGSSNDRMLNVRMPMLCQRCHVATKHPSSVYDNAAITTNKSNRMFGRSCVNCHSEHPRVEPPLGPVLHAVGQRGRTYATTVSRTCLRSADSGDLDPCARTGSGERRHRIHVRRWIGPGRVANAGRAGPADSGARRADPSESAAGRTGRSESGAGSADGDRAARRRVEEPVRAQLEHVPVLGSLEQHRGRPGALAAIRGSCATACCSPTRASPRDPRLEPQGRRGQRRLARSALFRQLRADRPTEDQRPLG